jgi:hypothetical protein
VLVNKGAGVETGVCGVGAQDARKTASIATVHIDESVLVLQLILILPNIWSHGGQVASLKTKSV